nr:MAG TPA: hypothetical protein [Caudoviricetes sp.]
MGGEVRPRDGFLVPSSHRAGSPLRHFPAYHASLPVIRSISMPKIARPAPIKLMYIVLAFSFIANSKPMKISAALRFSSLSFMVSFP